MNRYPAFALAAFSLLCVFSAQSFAGTLLAQQVAVAPGGAARHYLLYTPDSEQPRAKGQRPLVLVFHGNRQSAQQMSDSGSGKVWKLAADGKLAGAGAGGFYVAFLNGAAAGNLASGTKTSATWNDCDSNRANNVSSADDVAFVRALVDQLDNNVITTRGLLPRIDTSRVYAYGFSNGATMALRLGREAGNVIAAISAVSGTDPDSNHDECRETDIDGVPRRRPAAIMHGTADTLVPYNNRCAAGGSSLTSLGLGAFELEACRLGHAETVSAWRNSVGGNQAAVPQVFPKSLANPRPQTAPKDLTQIKCTRYGAVEDCIITGGGHVEPSKLTYVGALVEAIYGKQNNDAESVALAWTFFQRHTLPPLQ